MGKKRSESALLLKRTLTDPRPLRRPFIAGLFCVTFRDFTFSGLRDEGHRTSRIEARPHTRRQLRSGENREKSGGQIKWLSTSYSTGAPLVLCCNGPRCEWPPFQRRCGPPGSAPSSITVSRAAVGTEEEEEEGG